MKTAKTLSIIQLMAKFPDEAAAVSFVESQIWPNGVECPHCESKNTTPRPKRHGHRCNLCRKDFTVRYGTIFAESRLPLKTWLYAMYAMQTSRKGVSSLQISKELGVRQATAWFMQHRIRESCKDDGVKLDGVVEIDETYIGGLESNKHAKKHTKHRQGGAGKEIVLGMRERGGKTKAMHIKGIDSDTLHSAIYDNVADGSTIYTDELRGYNGIGGVIYTHGRVNHSAKEYVNGMASTNGIESVWAVLKRGYHGTYHQFSRKHLRRYIDEFSFRLNEGNCKIDTIDRMKSLVKASANKRLTYKKLIA